MFQDRHYSRFLVLMPKDTAGPHYLLADVRVGALRQQGIDPHPQGRMDHHSVAHTDADMTYAPAAGIRSAAAEKDQVTGVQIIPDIAEVQCLSGINLLRCVPQEDYAVEEITEFHQTAAVHALGRKASP